MCEWSLSEKRYHRLPYLLYRLYRFEKSRIDTLIERPSRYIAQNANIE